MNRLLRVGALACLVLLQACQNKFSNEVKPIDCTPVLANPRVDVVHLNDYVINNSQYTLFSILFEHPGMCKEFLISPKIHMEIDFLKEDGEVFNHISFDASTHVLGGQLETNIGLHFNGNAYARITATLATKGKTSEPITFMIKRPDGAN